jgi:hypothetical protein
LCLRGCELFGRGGCFRCKIQGSFFHQTPPGLKSAKNTKKKIKGTKN